MRLCEFFHCPFACPPLSFSVVPFEKGKLLMWDICAVGFPPMTGSSIRFRSS